MKDTKAVSFHGFSVILPSYRNSTPQYQVYNINYGHNVHMLEKSITLEGYSFFMSKIREFQKEFLWKILNNCNRNQKK